MIDDIRLDDWWKKHGLVKGAKFEAILMLYCLDTLKDYFKGETCLELGCAGGLWTEHLVNYFKRVIAVDGDLELVRETRNRIKSNNLEVVCSLFEELESNEKFDTILMAHILEHVADPILILRKAKNWLNDDGVILVVVPNANSLHRQAGVKMGLLKRIDELNEVDKKIGHRRVYTWETLKRDIESTGLKIKKMGGIFLKPLTNAQIEAWFTKEMMDAFYELGKEYPEIAAEIYVVCEK